MVSLTQWLTENVGEYYGRGEDPVVHVGQGWEIRVTRVLEPISKDLHVGWEVDITDNEKSMLFALTQL